MKMKTEKSIVSIANILKIQLDHQYVNKNSLWYVFNVICVYLSFIILPELLKLKVNKAYGCAVPDLDEAGKPLGM